MSSGAKLLGAVLALQRLDGGATATAVSCDDSKKYLSTDLLPDKPLKAGYLLPDIALLHYEALPRVRV